MTDLLGHFAQPAEAHEAYLITELGNLFLVKDAQTANGGIFNFIFQQKAEQLAQHAGLQVGDASWFFLHGRDNPVTYSPPVQRLPLPSGTQHIGLIKLTSSYPAVSIAQFGHNYTYDPNTQTLINPVQHQSLADFFQSSHTLRSGNSISQTFAGIEISGNGMSILKLDSALLTGTVPHGSNVRFISSPNNMMGVSHDGSKFVLYNRLVEAPVTGLMLNSYSSTFGYYITYNQNAAQWAIDQVERNNCPPDPGEYTCERAITRASYGPYRVWSVFYTIGYTDAYGPINRSINVYVKDPVLTALNVPYLARETEYDCIHCADYISYAHTWSTSSSGSYTKINSYYELRQDRPPLFTRDCTDFRPSFTCPVWHYEPMYTSENIRIRDTAPYDTLNYYTSNFIMTHATGSNKYVIAQPNGNTIKLNEQTTGVHPLTNIDGLPPDTYFKITVDNGLEFYGKTSRTGMIALDTDDIAIDTPSHSATLTLYVGSMTSMRVSPSNIDLGSVLFDVPNDEVLLIGTDGEAYAPFIHATIPTTDGLFVSNTYINGTKGQVHLPYLDGLYLGNEELWIPNVPGFDSVGTEFDGQPVTMLFSNLQFG